MRVSGPWLLAPGTQAALRLLSAAGHQAFVVGGTVRNALLGTEVSDIDIATSAHPEAVLDLAARAGLHAVPTGLEHGTVTVVIDGVGYEVTSFRRDVETFGRHARVQFSDSIHEDAARRDFTMNALYVCADGTLVDPLGGLPDLRARRVRFVGTPVHRIREDYLRILRFFRFHAQYGDPARPLDAAALAACAREAQGIESLSSERIGAEMRKLMAAPDPAPALDEMARTGVLRHVLPGARPEAVARLTALERQTDTPPRALRRLLAVGGATDRLCLTRAEQRALSAAARAPEDATLAHLGYRLGANGAQDAALVRASAEGRAVPPDWRAEIDRGAGASCPVRARDFPHLEGPALGAALRAVEDAWIASDFHAPRGELLA